MFLAQVGDDRNSRVSRRDWLGRRRRHRPLLVASSPLRVGDLRPLRGRRDRGRAPGGAEAGSLACLSMSASLWTPRGRHLLEVREAGSLTVLVARTWPKRPDPAPHDHAVAGAQPLEPSHFPPRLANPLHLLTNPVEVQVLSSALAAAPARSRTVRRLKSIERYPWRTRTRAFGGVGAGARRCAPRCSAKCDAV
jgi:hypothetical protein